MAVLSLLLQLDHKMTVHCFKIIIAFLVATYIGSCIFSYKMITWYSILIDTLGMIIKPNAFHLIKISSMTSSGLNCVILRPKGHNWLKWPIQCSCCKHHFWFKAKNILIFQNFNVNLDTEGPETMCSSILEQAKKLWRCY